MMKGMKASQFMNAQNNESTRKYLHWYLKHHDEYANYRNEIDQQSQLVP